MEEEEEKEGAGGRGSHDSHGGEEGFQEPVADMDSEGEGERPSSNTPGKFSSKDASLWAVSTAQSLAESHGFSETSPNLTQGLALALQQGVCDAVIAMVNCDEAYLSHLRRASWREQGMILSGKPMRQCRGAEKMGSSVSLPTPHFPFISELLPALDPAILAAASKSCNSELQEATTAVPIPPIPLSSPPIPLEHAHLFPAWPYTVNVNTINCT
jgi:hypothetical protein